MPNVGHDPQVDLVRRYARILRSAPAEALRASQDQRTTRQPGTRPAPVTALTDHRRAAKRPPAASSPA